MAGVLKNAFTVGSFTALSRAMGLVREMLQSRLVGAGMEQSAFTIAFALPNMSRKLFGEGALTAAFVPVFKGCVETDGIEEAAKLARAVVTMVMLLLGAVVALSTAGVLAALAAAETERMKLTLQLVAILLPYTLAICGAAFGMGVLNSLGRFKAPGFVPVILNVVWIAALAALAFFPQLSSAARIRLVSGAILFGGILQMAFMFVCMHRAGVSPALLFSGWRSERVVLVWRNLCIGALGAGAVQINYMLDQFLAQIASPWAAGVIGYAERLMDLPLGVIAVSFGTVLLPTFSGFFARGDTAGAKEVLSQSVKNQMFLMLPAAAGMFVLSGEIISAIYEGGKFGPGDTVRVARALGVYALGLGFFGLHKAIVPWFQAQHDMKTPLKVSVATVVVNAALNVLAVWLLPVEWRHVGLAASTVVCALIGFVALVVLARRRNGPLGLSNASWYVVRVAVASVLMAVVVLYVKGMTAGLHPIAALAAGILAGAASYSAFSLALRTFRNPLSRRIARGGTQR